LFCTACKPLAHYKNSTTSMLQQCNNSLTTVQQQFDNGAITV
jgi:hypothetical protein